MTTTSPVTCHVSALPRPSARTTTRCTSLPYLAYVGLSVRSLDDLLRINADATEEEIHCFRVAEGVTVTLASDGLWLLFEP